MIIINENYRIVGKDLNFTVESNQEIKEHFMTSPEKVGTKRWQTIGYLSTFGAIINFLLKQEDIQEKDLEDIKAIAEKIDSIIECHKNIDVNKAAHIKAIVNDRWYIVGTDMCYRIIKKEQIQSSRFTKEENVGKDKFISVGFVPNITLGLKTILNEIVLEHTSEKEETPISKLNEIIEEFIQDAENLVIEETSAENSNDDIDLETDDIVDDVLDTE